MTSIIKNQIVKHLSKFAHDLKPEQISLDVLKGKSKLAFIKLNEEVLTDVLELPSWLRIKSANCSGVTISVPWTKLKSSPVQIFIDEINVEVVLTSDAPLKKGDNPLSGLGDSGSYGFANKVVENLSLYITTVEINFDSEAFGGSFMLSRLAVTSRTPGWQNATDLKYTRISCSTANRTLIYKMVSWELLRIEASSKTDKNEKRNTINASLRLITNGGKIRIALKKNSTDGTVVHARIQTILEDILWVATLPQLRSALQFYSHIMELVKQSQKDRPPVIPPPPSRVSSSKLNGDVPPVSNSFRAFDFEQTSHHLHLKKVDLHLCDDAHTVSDYPPGWDIDSGAMQVTLHQVLIDIYPATLVTSDRHLWLRYMAPNAFTDWVKTRVAEQFTTLSEGADESTRERLKRYWPQLMALTVVVRMYDLSVQCVTDMTTKKDNLQHLFISDRQARSLPSDQFILHFEFSNFFHPLSDSLPVPSPASFLQLGPFTLLFEKRTLRWCLYVLHQLSTAIGKNSLGNTEIPHSDVRIDLIMPKLVLPLPDASSDRRLPHRLLVSLSSLSLSNCAFTNDNPTNFEYIGEDLFSYVKNSAFLAGNDILEKDLQWMTSEKDKVRDGAERFYLRTSPAWVDTDHGSRTKSLPVITDVTFAGALTVRPDIVNVYVEPTTQITAIIDHFQFLQLTRLANGLSSFFDLLSDDQKFFTANKESSAPIVCVLVGVKQLQANILLTMGSMPSPYDTCPTVTDTFMESLAELNAGPSRSNTPRRAPSATPLAPPTVPQPKKAAPMIDDFIERPVEFDTGSVIDDAMSVATSVEDESNFDFDLVVEDEMFTAADVAEEASTIDDAMISDRIYKSLMAISGNILVVELNSTWVGVNVHDKNVRVLGQVARINVKEKMNITREKAYAALKERPTILKTISSKLPQAIFTVNAPSTSKISFVDVKIYGLTAKLDDEIVSHIGAFSHDDHHSENKVRLAINVAQSNIEINDKKQKKPLRLTIRDCVIEQDEDSRED